MSRGIAACAAVFMGLGWCAGAQTLDEAIDQVREFRFGMDRTPLTALQDMVRATQEDPGARRVAAARLTALAQDETATLEARDFACRQLAVIAGPENVPGIARLLRNPETADMARYALEPLRHDAADRALLDALRETGGGVRIGVINSIGMRRTERAVSALRRLAGDEDGATAAAAIHALGKIGNTAADRALRGVARRAPEALQRDVADARIEAAHRLAEASNARAASRAFNELSGPGMAAQVRVAAFLGLLEIEGPAGKDRLMAALKSGDPALERAAKGYLRELSRRYAALADAH